MHDRAAVSSGNKQRITVNGVQLCIETFGRSGDPAILLIHGATTSMDGWEDEFCRRLAAGSRFVIRYDQRDTGQSVSYPPGQPGYRLADLVVDAAEIIDRLGIERAHVAGISMGGGIALGLALDYTERVSSLTLISTSPGGPDLPPMSEAFLTFISDRDQPDWSDRQAAVDHVLEFLRVLQGGLSEAEEAAMRHRVGASLERTRNVAASQINHFAMEPDEPRRQRLGEISMPTLVIHGDDDPVFPLGHGEALQREIPGATLLVLEGASHLLLRPTWDRVIPALLAHTVLQDNDEHKK